MYLKLPVLILTAIGIQASWRRADLDEGFPALQPKITSAVDPHPAPAPPPAPAPSPAPSAQLMDDTTKQLHISDIKQDGSNFFTGLAAAWIAYPEGIRSALMTTSDDMKMSDVNVRTYSDQTYEPKVQDIFYDTVRDLGAYWWPAAFEEALVQAEISQSRDRLVNTQPITWLSALTGRKALSFPNTSKNELWGNLSMYHDHGVPVIMTLKNSPDMLSSFTSRQDYAIINTSVIDTVQSIAFYDAVLQNKMSTNLDNLSAIVDYVSYVDPNSPPPKSS